MYYHVTTFTINNGRRKKPTKDVLKSTESLEVFQVHEEIPKTLSDETVFTNRYE